MEQYSFLEGSYYMANLGYGLGSTNSNSISSVYEYITILSMKVIIGIWLTKSWTTYCIRL